MTQRLGRILVVARVVALAALSGVVPTAGAPAQEGPRIELLDQTPVSPARAAEVIADLAGLDLHRHPHLDLLVRAWKLRENITAYDAMYVALAEALDAPLVTCDQPLASTAGHRATIEAIA